ncbi:hypothetical protein [Bifidobacterium breve]|uniref:hypothetical protein n=1 Tax=Bifidobacterium breve TaxID=1685 RepID=UPI002D11C50D|nr:hypothetical protein [Bifidobacterium breve]MEB3517288.1 hypothetical protein [Bifidobacterium breve]
MKIRMSAEQAAGLFEFAMLQDLDPTSMEPMKVSRDSAELRLVDGRPVFRVRVTALDRETGRGMDAVSLKIKSTPQAKIGRTFDLKLEREQQPVRDGLDAHGLGGAERQGDHGGRSSRGVRRLELDGTAGGRRPYRLPALPAVYAGDEPDQALDGSGAS